MSAAIPTSPQNESRLRAMGCFALLVVALNVTLGDKVRLSQWHLDADGNASVAEGAAWLSGRLDIPFRGPDAANSDTRPWDTAAFDGKVYNVFPPLVSVLTVALHPLHSMLLGLPDGVWSPWTFVWMVYWPLPIAAFLVFRRRVGDSAWAALLAFAFIGATAVYPNLQLTGRGLLGQMNHTLSAVGLLILADDLLGPRRIWPGLIGLLIATYTRQITFLYGLALLWAAWHFRGPKMAAACLGGLIFIVAPLLALNHAKFGSPLEFGYKYIYVGRDDEFARNCAEHGVFSLHFLLGNAWYMHLAPPELAEFDPNRLLIREANPYGTSIWITTPILLLVVWTAGTWWSRLADRALMLCTLLIMAVLLCYHTPGHWGHGYSRFAMDFIVIWLVVIAPLTRGCRRTAATLACIAWSAWYFQCLRV